MKPTEIRNQPFPCIECIVVARCINRERVQCRELRNYLVGKDEPQRSIGLNKYITLFKCDGMTILNNTDLNNTEYLIIKVYKTTGKSVSPYYYVISEPSGLHVQIIPKVVMKDRQ